MAWDSTQLRRFLATVENDRLYALWLTAAMTGARRGELLGLDVGRHRPRGRAAHHSTQPRRGRRRDPRERSEDCQRRAHDRSRPGDGRRAAAPPHTQKEEHLAAGRSWQGRATCSSTRSVRPWPRASSRSASGPPSGTRGRHSTPSSETTCCRASRLHGLRHTHATILLVELRWPVTVVSKRLGHKNEIITLTLYSEALPRYDGEAAAAFAGLVLPKGS